MSKSEQSNPPPEQAAPPGFARELALFPAAWGAYLEAAVRDGLWERAGEALRAAGPGVLRWAGLSGALTSIAPWLARAGRFEELESVASLLALETGVPPSPAALAWGALAAQAEREAKHWPLAEQAIASLFGSPPALEAARAFKSCLALPAPLHSIPEALLWSGRASDEALEAWGAADAAWASVAEALPAEKSDLSRFGSGGALTEFRKSRALEDLPTPVIERALARHGEKFAKNQGDSLLLLQTGILRRAPDIQAAAARALPLAWKPLVESLGAENLAHWAIAAAKKAGQQRGESGREAWEAWLDLAEHWLGPEAFAEKASENWDRWRVMWDDDGMARLNGAQSVAFDHPGGSLMACALACDALGRPGWASERLARRGVAKTARQAHWAWSLWAGAEALQEGEIVAHLGPNPKNPAKKGLPAREAVAASLALREALELAEAVKGPGGSGDAQARGKTRPPRSL